MGQESGRKPDEPKVSILKPGETGMRIGEPVQVKGSAENLNRDLAERIHKARTEYANMYEEHPRTWQILSFDEKFKVLVERLERRGINFSEPEKIILRTALQNSTVRMWTRAKDVNKHDGPDNPARIADRVARRAKRAAAAAKKNPPDSQEAA
jgi:hypothetical protein